MKKLVINEDPVIFHNTGFQTILIRVCFPFKKDGEFAKIELLPDMLNYFNNKYSTEEKFMTEKQKLFIISSRCYYDKVGDLNFFTFTFSIPNKDILNVDLYEKQFEFFSNFIYNPKVIKGSFSDKELEREKKNLRIGMKNWLDYPRDFAIVESKKIVDDSGLLSDDIFAHADQIDNVTGENLYDYYLDKIYNNDPLVYIMGDVDDKYFSNLAKKYLYQKKVKKNIIKYNSYNYLLPKNSVNNIVEKSNFNNSIILYYYKVKDIKPKDEVYLYIVCQLLSSTSSRLLSKKLRDENDLVYSDFSIYNKEFVFLRIEASINKKNYEIVKNTIEDVVNSLKDLKLITPLLEKIKDRERIELIKMLDSNRWIFENNIVKHMKIDITSQEAYENIIKVTPKDISCFIDRLVLDTIYYLKEGKNE